MSKASSWFYEGEVLMDSADVLEQAPLGLGTRQ